MSVTSQLLGTSLMTPIGELWLAKTDQGLCYVGLKGHQEIERLFGARLTVASDALESERQQIEEYLGQQRRSFALDLCFQGTVFQQRVWRATAQIPYGQVQSYGDIARTIGSAGAARAVGQALGANPLLIVVPCHRVLRADGGIGGFGAGLEAKRTLLALEGYDLE